MRAAVCHPVRAVSRKRSGRRSRIRNAARISSAASAGGVAACHLLIWGEDLAEVQARRSSPERRHLSTVQKSLVSSDKGSLQSQRCCHNDAISRIVMQRDGQVDRAESDGIVHGYELEEVEAFTVRQWSGGTTCH